MDETFAESVIHRRAPLLAARLGYSAHRVLGRRLRPFSFWHAANLDFTHNLFGFYSHPFAFARAFEKGAYWLSLPELENAVAICRLRFPHSLASSRLVRLARKLSRPLRAHNYFHAPDAFMRELDAFGAYFVDYHCGPIHGQSSDGATLKCPWYLVAVRRLRRALPELSEAQAWNTPVGYGSWVNAGADEAADKIINIMTPADRAAFAEAGIEI